jgi:hypothetical protein
MLLRLAIGAPEQEELIGQSQKFPNRRIVDHGLRLCYLVAATSRRDGSPFWCRPLRTPAAGPRRSGRVDPLFDVASLAAFDEPLEPARPRSGEPTKLGRSTQQMPQ